MDSVDFAYFMEEYLQETRTWARNPGTYEIDAPDQIGGHQTVHWHPDAKRMKQNIGDMKKLQKQGLRDDFGYLTAKGRFKASDQQRRFNGK